jgi:hypothetical protein
MSAPVPPQLPTSPEQTVWFYADANNQPVGPVPFDELRRLLVIGTLTAESYILAEKETEWLRLGSVITATTAPPIDATRSDAITPSLPGNATTEQQQSRVALGTSGCLWTGWGILTIIVGLGFCFTLIGAIIGIPCVFGGFLIIAHGARNMRRSGRDQFARVLTGACPHCGHSPISITGDELGRNCPACKKRIVIKGNVFTKVG